MTSPCTIEDRSWRGMAALTGSVAVTDEPPARDGAAKIALIMVHGIGNASPTSVLASARAAIQRRYPTATSTRPEELVLATGEAEAGVGRATVCVQEVRAEGQTIDLVEFYWAGIAGEIRLSRPVEALIKVLNVLTEFPLVAVTEVVSQRLRFAAWITGQLSRALVVVTLIGATAFVTEAIARGGGVMAAMDSLGLQVVIYTAVAAVFLFVLVLLYVLARVRLAVMPSGRASAAVRRAVAATMLVTVLSVLTIGALVSFLVGVVGAIHTIWKSPVSNPVVHSADIGSELVSSIWLLMLGGCFVWALATVTVAVANLMRDVVHYLSVDRDGHLRPNQRSIRNSLWQLLMTLRQRHYERVILVAHSLGTVIVVDLLTEKAREATGGTPLTVDLLTAGSPIRRFIQRVLPIRSARIQDLREELARSSHVRVERWFNAYRALDYVGQALTYSALPLDLLGRKPRLGDPCAGICEYLLTPWYRWPFMHANYWGDARFLNFVAAVVLEPVLHPRSRGPGTSGATGA